MAIHLSRHKISYFSVPKCACTSLKHFFFEIENGFPYRAFSMNGKMYHIHEFTPSPDFATIRKGAISDHLKVAVVRDPVKRIVSCYANKVVAQGALKRARISDAQAEAGIVRKPTIAQFVRDLETYQSLSPMIRHHSRPLSFFLGRRPEYFDRLFRMDQLPELVELVAARVDRVPELRHAQKSKSSDVVVALSSEDRRRIEERFSEDLEIFGDRF